MLKNTIRHGGSTAQYVVDTVDIVDTVDTVNTVDTVDTIDTVDTVHTVQTDLHYFQSSMYAVEEAFLRE